MRTSSRDDDSAPASASIACNDEEAGNGQERARKKLLYADVTPAIIDAFFAVYNKLGFGFLKNVYRGARILELRRRGHSVAREGLAPVFCDGHWSGRGTASVLRAAASDPAVSARFPVVSHLNS